MLTSIKIGLCSAMMAVCFVTSCGQNPNTRKLIDEVNAAKVNARELIQKAEGKRKEARAPSGSGDYDKLIQEAAKLYAQASDALTGAARKADEISKSKDPEWYQEYFTLQAKLLRNFARMGTGAHDELLARLNGPLNEDQERSLREDINRVNQENDELKRRIHEIETRQGVGLIKE